MTRCAIFKNYWGEIKGEKNKRMVAEFTEALEYQPLIANTQFYWSKTIDAKDALKPNFVEILMSHFEAAQPLNKFLREAIYD